MKNPAAFRQRRDTDWRAQPEPETLERGVAMTKAWEKMLNRLQKFITETSGGHDTTR